jgi:hypothetical protein
VTNEQRMNEAMNKAVDEVYAKLEPYLAGQLKPIVRDSLVVAYSAGARDAFGFAQEVLGNSSDSLPIL